MNEIELLKHIDITLNHIWLLLLIITVTYVIDFWIVKRGSKHEN